MNMKILCAGLGIVLCSWLCLGFLAQANGGVGAGFEGSLGVNQIRVVSEGDIAKKQEPNKKTIKQSDKKVSHKTMEQEPMQISQPEKTVEKKPRRQPSKEEFAKIVADNELYLSLEKALLAMDYQGFVVAMKEANRELGAWFGQGRFKKLAQQRVHDVMVRSLLLDGDYEAYTSYIKTKEKARKRTEQEFMRQKAKAILRQKLVSILEKQDYEGFVELWYASQTAQK